MKLSQAPSHNSCFTFESKTRSPGFRSNKRSVLRPHWLSLKIAALFHVIVSGDFWFSISKYFSIKTSTSANSIFSFASKTTCNGVLLGLRRHGIHSDHYHLDSSGIPETAAKYFFARHGVQATDSTVGSCL